VGFVLFAMLRDWIGRRMTGGGTMTVTRSDTSTKLFYAIYAAISGLLVAICLSVEAAKDHRIIWILVDTMGVAYVCLFNIWFRNYLVGLATYLTTVENR
jgi:hypothetical protein